jgi:hypothetical protein
MSTHIVELDHARSGPPAIVAGGSVDDGPSPERPLSVARGITSAVLISVPFWMLFAFALYLLI